MVSTRKLTDSLEEQQLLEGLLDKTKPNVPQECRHLHYLLSTPFRYRPYPHGSRFRRAGLTPGVFYAADEERTAVAEMAFYRLLFFAESALTPLPANPFVLTAFSALVGGASLDLTQEPFRADTSFIHPTDYETCQTLAETARGADAAILRYASVRDPAKGTALAVLNCYAFTDAEPQDFRTWRMGMTNKGVQATREFPRLHMDFSHQDFSADPRLARFSHMP